MSSFLDDNDLYTVLEKNIPWESYVTAKLISEGDLQLIRRYDKRAIEVRGSALEEGGPKYFSAFLSVLKAVSKEDPVQYVLGLLVQLLQEDPSRARFFHAEIGSVAEPYTIFLRLLQRQDWFIQENASRILLAIIQSRPDKSRVSTNGAHDGSTSSPSGSASSEDHVEQSISSFIDWLISQLRRPSNPSRSVPVATTILASLLRERALRPLFVRAGGVSLLPPLLKAANSPSNSQLLYELTLCVWQLTFLKKAAETLAASGIVKPLTDITRNAPKEKVFRVAMSSLSNLLDDPDLHNNLASDMIEAGLQKVVITRQMQTWADPDIPELLASMEGKLKKGVHVLSSFDKYRKEVMSGSLDWTPTHTSELFWQKNVQKFEERDLFMLRALLKLIESSQEAKTLAVGCHDLGMFIQHHSQGRFLVSSLHGKELVMQLMAHPDPDVQKQALLCVQRIMLARDKLEFLSGF